MIPLTYITPVKAQVAQYIEGTSRTGLNTVLRTVAVPVSNTYPLVFAASKD